MFFLYFQNDEPPEITYCMVDHAGTLQPVTPTLPMPPQDELDAKFAELVVNATFLVYTRCLQRYGRSERLDTSIYTRYIIFAKKLSTASRREFHYYTHSSEIKQANVHDQSGIMGTDVNCI